MNITDDFTRNLYDGMTLILSKYPNAGGCFDYDRELELWIEEKDNKLTDEDRQLLSKSGWYVEYPDIFSVWKYYG